LTSSLAVIPANLSQQQESAKEEMTQDTSGRTSENTLKQLDLFSASLKTSKATSRLDSAASSAIWKKMVTDQRGEYSQRVKSARLIRESASTSWATPNTMDYLPQRSEEALIRQATTTRKGRARPANLREQVNPTAVQIYQQPMKWPTVRVSSANGASQKELEQGNPKRRLETEVLLWPTPTSRDHKGGYKEDALTRKDGKSRRFDALPNAAIGGVGTDVVRGHLNPDWVEWLMGVPTGWTALGFWGMQ